MCRTKLCAFQSLTEVSALAENSLAFFVAPPDVQVCSGLSAQICVCTQVCVFQCVKHVGVCLQTAVSAPLICVSAYIHIYVFVCVWMNAQVFFSHPTVCFLIQTKTRCTYSTCLCVF